MVKKAWALINYHRSAGLYQFAVKVFLNYAYSRVSALTADRKMARTREPS